MSDEKYARDKLARDGDTIQPGGSNIIRRCIFGYTVNTYLLKVCRKKIMQHVIHFHVINLEDCGCPKPKTIHYAP